MHRFLKTVRRLLRALIYALTAVIGLLAFLYPVVTSGQAASTPLLLAFVVGLSFVALLLEVQGDAVNAKFVALLGILTAMNAALRFAEVAIPGPGGFSPIFFLIIVTGYVYGGRFGFLLGALTLLVSALITGGVGPWLPYQILTAGWVGLSAPLLHPLTRWLRIEGRWPEVALLALFGLGWGLLYGALLNLSSWAFIVGPGAPMPTTLRETVRQYGVFYVTTSLAWDLARGFGNVALTLAFGAPTLRVLRRFHKRFSFAYRPQEA
jgi:energy-coupling factor transport system substrate-specific component